MIRILLADDHRIMREGLRALLAEDTAFQVVAEAGDGETAVRLAAELRPHVVILDISMPDLNGIDAARRIAREVPQARIIALSKHTDKRFVLDMMRAGASGYLLKDCAFEDLAAAVRAVVAGRTFLSSAVTDVVVRAVQEAEDETGVLAMLSEREREVFQMLAEGKSSKQIGGLLGVSVKTVDSHRQNVMRKLEVDSIAMLAKIAIREGLVPLDD